MDQNESEDQKARLARLVEVRKTDFLDRYVCNSVRREAAEQLDVLLALKLGAFTGDLLLEDAGQFKDWWLKLMPARGAALSGSPDAAHTLGSDAWKANMDAVEDKHNRMSESDSPQAPQGDS